MALDWKINPQFVARGTYQTPSGAIGFEGKLVQAILEKSGRFIGSPEYIHHGDWSHVLGKFTLKQGQKGGEYAVPAWTAEDAIGLGVIVKWQVKGESKARFWPSETQPFWLTQCYPLNSPQWATDPASQIQYLAIRRFADHAAPGILGGVAWDHEELLDASERARDVTPANSSAFVGSAGQTESGTPPEDNRPVYEVTDNDGAVVEFRSAEMVQRALGQLWAEAKARNAIAGLDAAWENNEAVIEAIRAVDTSIGDAIVTEFAERRLEQVKIQAEPSTAKPAQERAGSPQGGLNLGEASGTTESKTPAQVASAEPAQPQRTVSMSFFDRADLELPPPVPRAGGKLDLGAWATAMFLPRAGQARNAADLARFIGANEGHLNAYTAAFPRGKASMDKAIADIYARFEEAAAS
jgi:hypothetical protein